MLSSQIKLPTAFLTGAAVIGAALAGCAGNGAGLDANGLPIGSSGGGGTTPLTADFQSIQDNVFTPICSPCHSGATAPQGLMLDAGHSYNLLVGVPSNEVPSLDRVKAGDPDNSYIILKLQGSPGIVGSRMPLNETPLPQSTIDVIRQWITNGAPPSQTAMAVPNAMAKLQAPGGGAAPAPLTVTDTSPVDGAILAAPVSHIVIAFNHELDASLVNYTTLTVERLASSQSEGQPDAPAEMVRVPSFAALAGGNPNVIVITPVAPLVAGTYRVTARGSGGGALADLNARTLSGDYSFEFNVEASQ